LQLESKENMSCARGHSTKLGKVHIWGEKILKSSCPKQTDRQRGRERER